MSQPKKFLPPCYYQSCKKNGTTKEHIPPKSFFPMDQRNQLLTVPSCESHNTAKSRDDTYVLAQICMNASPSNQSREVFIERVAPQLGYKSGSLRAIFLKDAVSLPNGAVIYGVDIARFDHFFTALSCGIIYKVCKNRLPDNYSFCHVYHNFQDSNESAEEKMLKQMLDFYSDEPMGALNFGQVRTLNENIYSVKVFGVSNFSSSITVVHEFFGTFRVTSLLTNTI